MKSANPENEYIPLDLRISVRRDTLRLISEMAQDMGISINEVFSFLAEDSVIDLELLEDLKEIEIPSKCSIDDYSSYKLHWLNIDHEKLGEYGIYNLWRIQKSDLNMYSEFLVNSGYKSDWKNRKVEKF